MISVDHWVADPETVARWPRSVGAAWSRGPVVPSGPVPRPQPGLGWVSQDPESVARWTRSVGAAWSRGPVVPSGLSLSLAL